MVKIQWPLTQDSSFDCLPIAKFLLSIYRIFIDYITNLFGITVYVYFYKTQKGTLSNELGIVTLKIAKLFIQSYGKIISEQQIYCYLSKLSVRCCLFTAVDNYSKSKYASKIKPILNIIRETLYWIRCSRMKI